jgi:hypothetical protein
MKSNSLPKTKIGRLSFGILLCYLLLLAVFFTLMLLGLVTFDYGHWWDWTVGISVLLMLASFVTGLIAVFKDRSVWIYASLFINSCAILFLLLHSLFIND